jgi:hypothetical protein
MTATGRCKPNQPLKCVRPMPSPRLLLYFCCFSSAPLQLSSNTYNKTLGKVTVSMTDCEVFCAFVKPCIPQTPLPAHRHAGTLQAPHQCSSPHCLQASAKVFIPFSTSWSLQRLCSARRIACLFLKAYPECPPSCLLPLCNARGPSPSQAWCPNT